MSGTIPLSMTQQLNELGAPLSGGKLYLIQAGTVSTPQNGYQDPGLSITLSNPITLDAAGRLPQFFLADGYIKIRLLDSTGIVQREADNIQVIGPSGGGGGGGTIIDPNSVLQTGDMVIRYGTGVKSGFVRCNALTIGNATSGASERANADCQSLFIHLYGADANLAVSGGRSGNALNDYNASKTLALPDFRGRAIAGLDDMGNAAAGRLTASYFGTSAIVLGAAATSTESKTLLTANLPAYTPAGTLSGFSATVDLPYNPGVGYNAGGVTVAYQLTSPNSNTTKTVSITTGSFSGTAQGGASTPFSTVQPTMLATVYLRL